MEIFLPNVLNEKTVITVVNALWQYHDEQCFLDISNLNFVRPFGALVLATELAQRYEMTNNPVILQGRSDDRSAHSYLAHVGFFKAAYFDIGNEIGSARGTSNYFPFRRLNEIDFINKINEWENEYGIERPIQFFINKEAEKLSGIITRNPEEVNYITYCFREVIRNVFEHSYVKDCFVFGQKWENGEVEIGITDKGIGVLTSLQEKFGYLQEVDALLMCIEPGVSSKDITIPGDWTNSGFGLYVLSEIGKQFGQFMLCSGGSGLVCSRGRCKIINCFFHGTAIQLKLNLNQISNLATSIEEIVSEGERIATAQGRVVKASKSTRFY